jgi:hypothetical protein
MRAPSYIPATDSGFLAFLVNFSALITANPTDYGLTAGNATTISGQLAIFEPALALATDPSTKTPVTVAAKDAARVNAIAIVRPFAQAVAKNPAISDALKIGLGLNPPNTSPSPIPPITVAPAISLVSAQIGSQTLNIRNPETPDSKAKPAGASGIQLFRSVGTTHATDPAQCSLHAVATKTPLNVGFEPSESGKKVTYFARYVTPSGPGGKQQEGPFSAPLNATIL